jgi:hypothetical protein
MNFKLKALVAAAVATVTMSGAANALTNNEMFLVAYDSVASKTFIAALGAAGSTSAFTGGSNLSVNYATDANWTNFMTGATASNITYQVLGFYSVNPALAGGYNSGDKLVVSSNATPGTFSNSGLNSMMGDAMSNSGIAGGFLYLNSAVTGTSTGLVLGSGLDSGSTVGTNVFTKYTGAIDTTAALGTDLGFYSVTRPGSTSNLTQTIKTQYVQGLAGSTRDTFNLSSAGVFTYAAVAAVPETDSLSMAMLGIGLMGFVARRRRNNNV